MEPQEVINALLAKRDEMLKTVADLERQIRKWKADIAQVEATISFFGPSNVTQAKREATKFARSAHFVTGELTRRCQQALREADGKEVSADSVAVQAMRDKNLSLGDGELRADMSRRILWTFNRMVRTGAVCKHGNGALATWTLPTT